MLSRRGRTASVVLSALIALSPGSVLLHIASPHASAASQLDGNWTATFTVNSSSVPIAQPGQQLTGLTFSVEGSQISGDINGTIDLSTQTLPTISEQVYVAQVTSDAIGAGVSCQGDIYFNSQGFSYVGTEYEDSISCNGGQITGSLDGYRITGSSTGTSTTTTTPTSTCGVSTAPFAASGDFATVTVDNQTDAPVVVFVNIPVGGAVRLVSLTSGESSGFDEETGSSIYVTSESSGKCLGHWKIASSEMVTLPKSGSPTATAGSSSSTTTTIAGTPCLETATCVVPLLRAPTVSHGSAILVDDKTGARESLPDVRSLVPYDSVHTSSTGVARLAVTAGAVTAGASVALVIGAGSVWALPALPIVVLSGSVFQLASLQTLGDVLYDVSGRSLQPEVRTSEMITRVNYAACGNCVAAGAIPHAQQTPVASFSVEITKSYSRVRVYAGAVTVKNLYGARKAVIVRAGFQSLVRRAGPPTTPSRFAMPKAPFWQ